MKLKSYTFFLASLTIFLVGCSSAPKYYITNSTVEPETRVIYQNNCPPTRVFYAPQPVVTFEPIW